MLNILRRSGVDEIFIKHHLSMATFELPDLESEVWLYKNLSLYYSQELPNLSPNIDKIITRVHIPIGHQIINAATNQSLNTLKELLAGYKIESFWLNDLPIIDIVPIDTPQYSGSYLRGLKQCYRRLYPNKLRRRVHSQSANQEPLMEDVPLQYKEWLQYHSENLIPEFKRILGEIKDELKRVYRIKPSKEGFIRWYARKELMIIEIKFVENSRKPRVLLQLTKFSPPRIRDRDLHDYCIWRQEEQKKLFPKQNGYPASTTDTTTPMAIKDKKELSHAEIAILYHVTGWYFNPNLADEIAMKYGQTSGQRLITYHRDLTSVGVRTGKSRHRVQNYKNIESYIPDDRKAQYVNELKAVEKSNQK